MLIVLAFLCRFGVFLLLSLLSTLASREYTLSMYERILVSSLQILIFGGMLGLYEVCCWIIRGMSNVEMYKTVTERRLDEEPEVVDVEGVQMEEAIPEETQSNVSNQTEKIVFLGSRELRRHVWWVYYLGVLCWCTIFCLDFTLLSTTFFFSVGLSIGWVFVSIWQQQSISSQCLRLMYVTFLGVLCGMYVATHKQVLDADAILASRDALIAVIIPLLAGIGWMQIPTKELTKTMYMSFFTCCLLCMPLMMIVDTKMFQDIFAAAPPGIMVYLLMLEPILKSLAVYTIALSLQTNKKLDLLVVLLVVVHLDDILFLGMKQTAMAVTVTVMVLLLSMHMICLVLTTV